MQKNQNINSFSVSPSLDEYGIISQEYKSIYLSVEIKDIDVDPLQIYKLLKSENCFYMQKTLPGQSEAYETIMGLKNEKVEKISGQNPVEKIREIIKENKLSTFCSKNYNHNGLFSYFSYECFKYFDKVPKLKKDPNNLPECIIIIPELISTYHHKNKKLIISKKINKPINKNAYIKTKSDLIEIAEKIHNKLKNLKIDISKKLPGSKLTAIIDKNKYIKKIESIKKEIISGELIQCVLTQRFKKTSKVDDQYLIEYLSQNYPSEYIYQISLKEFSITGSSPEMFLKVANKIATIRPVAGTIASIKGETKELIDKLKSSVKDKAEHIMLVDLARNDLGKVANPGSVKVDKLMETMVYNNVIHLVSEVNGELRDDKDFLDAFSSTFPIGTLVGAPKIRAAELINDLEEEGRGPYCGAIGWFSCEGNLEASTIIRTVIKKDEELSFNGGGGIVFDSIPEVEYQETLDKVKAFW
tara:strand:- start:3421 stop:4833 length:1413 start_codon:yes stop_codon:yes gene_type:complete